MNYQFPISSARIDYLPLTIEDVKEWKAFFVDNPMLQYLAINEPDKPKKEAKKWVKRQLYRYKESGWGHLKMVDRSTKKIVGQTGLLMRCIDEEDLLEIGYSIIPRYWGMGYASEAAQCMKAYMKEHQLHTRAVSMIHVDNIGSQRVAEKNGMKRGRDWEYMDMPVYIYEAELS